MKDFKRKMKYFGKTKKKKEKKRRKNLVRKKMGRKIERRFFKRQERKKPTNHLKNRKTEKKIKVKRYEFCPVG